MRIIQISDFHFTKLTANPFRLLPKRIFSHFNWLFRRKKEFSLKQVEALPEIFKQLNADLILLGGDFSSSSMPEEFRLAKAFVEKIPCPWIAIPGNHDKYTYGSFLTKRFFQYFSNKCPKIATLQKEGVEAHQIAPHLWVVAMDTAKPCRITSSEGDFSEALEAQVEYLLSQIPQSERVILLNHYPFFLQEGPKRSLKRGKQLESLIRRHPNISLYLHGHTHRHSIADLRPDGLPIVLDSGSASLSDGGSWNVIDIDDSFCKVTPYQFKEAWEEKQPVEFTWA